MIELLTGAAKGMCRFCGGNHSLKHWGPGYVVIIRVSGHVAPVLRLCDSCSGKLEVALSKVKTNPIPRGEVGKA